MNAQVPTLSIVFMGLSCAAGFLIPLGLLLYFRFKKRADILPFFVGCAIMILFSFILETVVHSVVLRSAAGAKIQNSPFLMALYGGIMAALFEECGRYLAFRSILKNQRGNDMNALMYGAGHGGIEALVLIGIGMVSNILYSLAINSGNAESLLAPMSAETRMQVEGAFNTLITTPSYHFLLGLVERCMAVVLQLALSVFVWFAVKSKGKAVLLAAAFLIHFLVDFVTAFVSRSGAPVVLTEAIVLVFTVAAVFLARAVWKQETQAAKDGTLS